MPANRLLVLLRHGQSEWNLKNLFTGWRDVDLSPAGVEEAKEAGRRMKARGLAFDLAFTSALIRAQRTLALALAEMGQTGLPERRDQALNERDYGDLVGLNKDDARKKWGEEQVHKWRRSYDIQPPGGESLKDTVARALPYYCQNILPAGARRQARAGRRARQQPARPCHGARPPHARNDPDDGARDRRSAGLSAEPRLDRRQQGDPDGLTRPAAACDTTGATGAFKPTKLDESKIAFFCFLSLSFSFRKSGLFKGLRPKKLENFSPFSNSRSGCARALQTGALFFVSLLFLASHRRPSDGRGAGAPSDHRKTIADAFWF